MSQKEMTDTIRHLEINESTNRNLSRLAELARRAYEEKRTKDCLDATRTILLIDPDNADANLLRTSIQLEMHRDLENARAFLRQAQSKESAETQLQPSQTEVSFGLQLSPVSEDLEPPLLVEAVELPALSATPQRSGTQRLVRASIPIVFGAVVIFGVVLGLPKFRSKSNPVEASPPSSNAPDRANQVPVNAAQPVPGEPTPSAEIALASTPTTDSPTQPVTTPRSKANSPAALAPDAKPDRPVIVVGSGTLAVSSPTSVDIYKDDAYIGSVPISLELPAGMTTLEYRHGNLRTRVTHVITGNETTRAMITFDVSVRINSRPWADVFIDGVAKKALGQTPLSDVRVPIGSVLLFENPQFAAKKYRVTGSETGIQIVFP